LFDVERQTEDGDITLLVLQMYVNLIKRVVTLRRTSEAKKEIGKMMQVSKDSVHIGKRKEREVKKKFRNNL